MLKDLFNLIKKIVFSVFLIYGFNLMANPLNLIIPINVINVGFVNLLGLHSLLSLILVYFIVF